MGLARKTLYGRLMKGIDMKNNIISFLMIIIVLVLIVSISYSENKTEKQSSVPENNSSDWVK